MSELENFGFVMPHWLYWGWLAVMPLIMMTLDHFFSNNEFSSNTAIPGRKPGQTGQPPVVESNISNTVTRKIDFLSEKSGVFVAFWTINAVVFYVFEVVMRYAFNMPTLWAHEASFLLLGMQYFLAGAYAMLYGAHVRVDIVYSKLPRRGRIGMDIFTSMFFFVFVVALGITSWRYFIDAYRMNEVTVETWGIQYWPVKGAIVLGSVLLFFAGLSKLIKDITLFIKEGDKQDQAKLPQTSGDVL